MKHKKLLIPSLTLIATAPILANVGCSKTEFHWNSITEEKAIEIGYNIRDLYHKWRDAGSRFGVAKTIYDQKINSVVKKVPSSSYEKRIYEADIDKNYIKGQINGWYNSEKLQSEYSYLTYDLTRVVDNVYNVYQDASTVDYMYSQLFTFDTQEKATECYSQTWNRSIYRVYGFGDLYNAAINPEQVAEQIHKYVDKYKDQEGFFFHYWLESKNDNSIRVLIDARVKEYPFRAYSKEYTYFNYKLDVRIDDGLINYVDKSVESELTPAEGSIYDKTVEHSETQLDPTIIFDEVDLTKFQKRP